MSMKSKLLETASRSTSSGVPSRYVVKTFYHIDVWHTGSDIAP